MSELFEKMKKLIYVQEETTCNEEIGIYNIKNNFIYTRDGYIITGIKIHSINTSLLTEKEKYNLITELSAELSSEQLELKYFNIARPIDITELQEYLQNIIRKTSNSIQKRLLREHLK